MKGSLALAMLALGHVGRSPVPPAHAPFAAPKAAPLVTPNSAGPDAISTAIADLAKDWTPKLR